MITPHLQSEGSGLHHIRLAHSGLLDCEPRGKLDFLFLMRRSAEIAIVGAGPAGAHLASLLAAAGRDVVLFDPKGAWEKPCGGGVTARGLREYSFLLEQSRYPLRLVRRITLVSPSEITVSVELEQPFAIYSRQVLNGLILDRAVESGAMFAREVVADFDRDRDVWRVKTRSEVGEVHEWRVNFLVGADGAASFTRRRLVGIFPTRDLAIAFGYNVAGDEPGDSSEVTVKFQRKFTGYLWAFPRPGGMNFGVASKLGERSSGKLRSLLGEFVASHYHSRLQGRMPEPDQISFFGAKIPTLDLASWTKVQVAGSGWALVGDAAGFADPITGEGIYYAMRSADLLADALKKASHKSQGPGRYECVAEEYERLWRVDFGRELEHASYRLPQFYHGRFLGHVMTDAVVRFARLHRGVRHVLSQALVGDQSYITLKRDLLRRAHQVL